MNLIHPGEHFVGTSNLQLEFFPKAWGRAEGEKILGVVFRRPKVTEKDQKAAVQFLTTVPHGLGAGKTYRRWSVDFQNLMGEEKV